MLSNSINTGSPAKRIRINSVWTRATSPSSSYASILMREIVPYSRLVAVTKSERFDGIMNEEEMRFFNKWLSSAKDGYKSTYHKTVYYTQNDYTKFLDMMKDGERYEGCIKFGRMFAKNNLGFSIPRAQNLKKIIRNTLYQDTHYDVDMVNCHPTIAAWLFRELSLPSLFSYVEDRDKWIEDFKDISKFTDGHNGTAKCLPAPVVKKAVNACLNGSGKYFGFHGQDMHYARSFELIPFFSQLINDRDEIYEYMATSYSGLLTLARCVNSANGNTNINGKALSLLLQDVENECLRSMYMELWDKKDIDGDTELVFLFDGMLIPKSIIDLEGTDMFIARMESAIESRVGIQMKVSIKPMGETLGDVSFDEEIEEGINEETTDVAMTYAAFKTEFEKMFYRIEVPMCYARENADGTVSYFNQSKFQNEVCAEYDKDMVKEWIADKTKRKYEKEVFAPPPQVCPERSLNTFDGLRGSKLDPVEDEKIKDLVKPLLKQIWLLSGGVKDYSKYVIKWLAYRVQNPGKLMEVGLAFRSIEGVGKDSFFSFFGRKILGDAYFHQAPEMSSIFGDKHTTATKDKLLMVISECSRSDSNSVKNKMKSFMTSPQVKFRPLYIEESKRDNFCGVVMFGQDQQFLGIEGDDRRFFVVDCLPVMAGKRDYFDNLIGMYERDDVARAFYQYLMGINLDGFHISSSRPVTVARKDMVSFSAKPFYVFLNTYIRCKDHEINVAGNPVAKRTKFTVRRPELFEEYCRSIQDLFPKHAQDLCEKRKFDSNVRCMHVDSMYLDGSIYRHAFEKMTNGKVKIDIEMCLKFLEKYVDCPDDIDKISEDGSEEEIELMSDLDV